ncbi:MAG: acylphosphatase [Candidatus Micrarchaeota archaeon]
MGGERLHFVVTGVVQGVFFGASTKEKVDALSIFGWIRNRSSGKEVEGVAEGERAQLKLLLVWLRRGPPGATVEKIDFSWEKATGEFFGFLIRE